MEIGEAVGERGGVGAAGSRPMGVGAQDNKVKKKEWIGIEREEGG